MGPLSYGQRLAAGFHTERCQRESHDKRDGRQRHRDADRVEICRAGADQKLRT